MAAGSRLSSGPRSERGSVIHTWDLARALGVDDTLDAGLVAWIGDNLDTIYAGVAEGPTDAGSTHRFFSAPPSTRQGPVLGDRLLLRMGRRPQQWGRPHRRGPGQNSLKER